MSFYHPITYCSGRRASWKKNTAECIFTGDTDILFTDTIQEYNINTAFKPDSYSIDLCAADFPLVLAKLEF